MILVNRGCRMPVEPSQAASRYTGQGANMKHAFRVFAVLTFGLAACAQMSSEPPAGGREVVQQAAAADDRETWTAVGNEPGWLLKIDAEKLMLHWNYGEEEAALPRPGPSVSADGRRYVSRTDAHDLRVDVTYRICRDTMTGMTIGNTRATRMACSPALDSQETEFLALLEAVHYFDIADDGALFLHTGNGATIKARRE
jgi:uncharacterized membrane protein